MENIFKAHTREINGKTFFFVKKYTIFPEYDNLPPVLNAMGMHTNFYKASRIAGLYDDAIISGLLNELHIIPDSAREIRLHRVKTMTHSFLKNTQQALLKLRLAGG